ncbi:hypothetical protein CHLNCDRAFT_143862 [Chlorella variabilis]|uniref:Uncharacterized protein n=1 Tax=Chlorella variabilis TaxID=554065 RepID=E1ZAL7_CHLVA|nr:hypothetical protein CHLNCDRAFT_143862 [Chlorella variabilis]EFN57085.1 hypothetical protein CHLNCDRAFT_143862 [Chlorella variabilis]|eukprot:XP_005849187.1 hypothetical protein CHLNCDRAFT_143862 [Chlorella variabilis]
MAIGFWAACHAVQPSKTLARPLASSVANSKRGAALRQGYNAAMAQATATVRKLSWLRKVPGADPARLTVSLAESLCLRATIKPLTFPFKLWAAYKLTVVSKQAMSRDSNPSSQRSAKTANSNRTAAAGAGKAQPKSRGK